MKFAIFPEYFFSGLCALAVLLILRLVFGKRLSGTGRFFLVAYVLYLSALYSVVGIPGLPYLYWGPNVNLIPFSDFQDSRFLWLSGMNVLLTVPLGFLLPMIWQRYRNFGDTFLAGFGTSLSIEVLQLFSGRSTDIDDLIFNTLGACLGFLLAKLLFGKRFPIGVRSGKKDLLALPPVRLCTVHPAVRAALDDGTGAGTGALRLCGGGVPHGKEHPAFTRESERGAFV